MPIKRLVKGRAFDPDEVELLVRVFEAALRDLNLAHGANPATELVANRIMSLRYVASATPFDCAKAPLRASEPALPSLFTLPKTGALCSP
jgi:hypothetical protein